jgi:hypothetical protein
MGLSFGFCGNDNVKHGKHNLSAKIAKNNKAKKQQGRPSHDKKDTLAVAHSALTDDWSFRSFNSAAGGLIVPIPDRTH